MQRTDSTSPADLLQLRARAACAETETERQRQRERERSSLGAAQVRIIFANSVSLLDTAQNLRLTEIPRGALVVARDPSRLPPDMLPSRAAGILYASGAAPAAGTAGAAFESQHHANRILCLCPVPVSAAAS